MNYEDTEKKLIKIGAYLEIFTLVVESSSDDDLLKDISLLIVEEINDSIGWSNVRQWFNTVRKLAEEVKE